MKPKIKILDIVVKKLKDLNEPAEGKLFGIFVQNTLLVLGLELTNNYNLNLSYSFPAEIDFCGVFEAYADTPDKPKILENCKKVEVTDNPVFILVKLTLQNDIKCNILCNNKETDVSYTLVSKQEIYSDFVHVRLSGDFEIKSEQNEQQIKDHFTALRKTIASGVMAFSLSKLNVLLVTSDSKSGIIGLAGDPTIGEICQEANGANEGPQKKKKSSSNFELEIVEMSVIKRVTRDLNNTETKSHSPVVILNKEPVELLTIPIRINFLAMVHKKTKLSAVYDILLESAIKNLRLFESVLKKTSTIKQVDCPDTMHFFPDECGHFLTRILFSESQEELKKERELLHEVLLLSKTSPMFRKANQYKFIEAGKNNGPLINPHEGVKPTNNGGKICLVQGLYKYYHYCQNGMDDNGWGCAYRSLQTLASWFKLQGYRDREVPTFAEIQKCLVDIGDKPHTFVNSRAWIGSTEVNFVLNTLFDITSTILYVSSGEEMGSKGPELVNHFETYGTPVMIGGGTLAHTILGVDYNQQTGSLKFLILDPHYTGAEDLGTIQNKGWCGWKGVEFWDKNSYYNMCLPRVPREV